MAIGVVGFVDGRPVPGEELERRLLAVRGGPRAAVLPVPGSAEDRQLRRWVAQVLLTEELCRVEAAARGLPAGPAAAVRLDQRAAVELGSITAAAYEGCAAVRAVYEAVTAQVTVPADDVARYRAATAVPPPGPVWRVSVDGDEFDAHAGTLPLRLAQALRAAGTGRAVGVDGRTATLVADDVAPGENPDRTAAELTDAARRLAFVRWLEHARSARLRLVPGLEHPGDPRQPDNHHRH
jgi:[acyl-carrier-protein] S-malonyltransferase